MTGSDRLAVSTAYRARIEDLRGGLAAADVDRLLLYGNNWHADFLRYASDFSIVEGQGLALFERDGRVTLLLDDPAEAERARAETFHEVVSARDLVGAAKIAPNTPKSSEPMVKAMSIIAGFNLTALPMRRGART